jgi:hypothetical protein
MTIEGGPLVYAMCAIDALGMADMLGRNIVIASADPVSGHGIRIAVADGHASWLPGTAVVFVGADSSSGLDCCPPSTRPAADRCCGVMNFFTGPDTAQAWIGQHPTVSGEVLSQAQAWRLGVDIFGHLLDE